MYNYTTLAYDLDPETVFHHNPRILPHRLDRFRDEVLTKPFSWNPTTKRREVPSFECGGYRLGAWEEEPHILHVTID